MKEDHSFESIEEKNTPEVVEEVKEEITEETPVQEVLEQKEEVKKEEVPVKKEDKTPKKPINIGLIALGIFVGAIAFVYIFLGTPIISFTSSSEDGDSFSITFSKIESMNQEKLQKELESKEAEVYNFEDGFYISDVGIYITKNGNSLVTYYTGDGKSYTSDIKTTEREYYENDDEEMIPFVNEYTEFSDSNNNKVKLESYFGNIKYTVGERTYFLKKNDKPYQFEGLYRDGNKYIMLLSCYDITERLSNVEGIYFDGTTYGVFNFDNILDIDGDTQLEEEVTKNNVTTLTGKLYNDTDIFKLTMTHNGETYNFKFDYKVYNSVTGSYDTTSPIFEKLEGNYTK